ncbi:hypothetical protein H6P81_021695 [Aristolochia fimbriata]|uniref:Uncharacterized protein n=1 Tax=Aristolochia fimbriata TaxID=158543 RepID=A0AAV7DQ67_ARIFI|nr:hypothetical protein H6P81_021695 [Aristolochia fimbriata]
MALCCAHPYPPPGNSQASMRDTRAAVAKTWARKPGRSGRRDGEVQKIACITPNLEGNRVKIPEPGRMLTATLGSPETPGGGSEELSFLFNSLPTLETAQPEVGSSCWKSTATPRWCPGSLGALKTGGPKVPTPGRIITASGLQGKGSRQNGSRTRKRIGSEGWGTGVPGPNPPGCRWTARAAPRAQSWSSRVAGTDRERPFGGLPGAATAVTELAGHCPSFCSEGSPASRSGGRHCRGEFGWGAHPLKDNARCPKMSSTKRNLAVEQKEFTKCWIVHPPIGNGAGLRPSRRQWQSGLAATHPLRFSPMSHRFALPSPRPARVGPKHIKENKTLSRAGSPPRALSRSPPHLKPRWTLERAIRNRPGHRSPWGQERAVGSWPGQAGRRLPRRLAEGSAHAEAC